MPEDEFKDRRRIQVSPGGTVESDATVAGGDSDGLPSPADDAVEVEGPAPIAARAPQAGPESVSIWTFRHGEKPREASLDELHDLVEVDANVVWVDIADYTERDLRELAVMLDLHPSALDAALDAWHRPQLDVFPDQFSVSVTLAHVAPNEVRPRVVAGELDLFVRRNALVSAHRHPLPFATRVLARAKQSVDLPRLDSAYLLYVVLDELLHHNERIAEQQEDAIALIEERALRDTTDDFLDDLLQLKRAVVAFGRLVDQHREIFAAFLRPEFATVAGLGMVPYFRDLEERLLYLIARLGAAKASVDGAFDIYVSHMSYRINEIVRLLTIVSTVLLPAALIMGFFGTQFHGVPIFSPTAFYVMLILVVLVTGAILAAFYRRGWITWNRRSSN
jgi:magnesium transporter